jgi:threonine dehydratase
LQVPPRDRSALRRFLADLGYRHWDETGNPAYQLFLR